MQFPTSHFSCNNLHLLFITSEHGHCFVRGEVLTSNINTVLQRVQGYDAAYFGRYV
jgi:hypothetical protein